LALSLPLSDLLPYTTLCRSRPAVNAADHERAWKYARCDLEERTWQNRSPEVAHVARPYIVERVELIRAEPRLHSRFLRTPHLTADRKSTRLNSSHVKISYAV